MLAIPDVQGGERNGLGRREKRPKKSIGRTEKGRRKIREEGEMSKKLREEGEMAKKN